jgi:large subunit ribosomal protein L6
MTISRIGKQPITIPSGVTVNLAGKHIEIAGPKGKLEHTLTGVGDVTVENGVLSIAANPAGDKNVKAFHGLARALVQNMVIGVSEGFTRVLEIDGVGYRAKSKGRALELSLGFSHPVKYTVPEGVTVEVDKENNITLQGIDKQLLGQVAAEIRGFRPPEPYKGKGIRYAGERIQRKVGKAGV